MDMRKIFHTLYLILFLCGISIHAQSLEQEAEYAEKICKKIKSLQPHYQKLVVKQFKKNGDSTNVDDIDFLNIYTVYATKKAERIQKRQLYSYPSEDPLSRLLNWIDPPIPFKKEDLLTYIDPKKIDCKHSLLYKDSNYIGIMVPYANQKERWIFAPPPFYFINVKEKNALWKIVKEVRPDVIFEICQGFEYFLIKDKRIYGIIYDLDHQEYSTVSFKEYIEKRITTLEEILNLKKEDKGEIPIEALSREYPFDVKYEIWEKKK